MSKKRRIPEGATAWTRWDMVRRVVLVTEVYSAAQGVGGGDTSETILGRKGKGHKEERAPAGGEADRGGLRKGLRGEKRPEGTTALHPDPLSVSPRGGEAGGTGADALC